MILNQRFSIPALWEHWNQIVVFGTGQMRVFNIQNQVWLREGDWLGCRKMKVTSLHPTAAQMWLLTGAGSCSPLLVTSWEVGWVPNSAEGMQAEGSTTNGPYPGYLNDKCEGKWGCRALSMGGGTELNCGILLILGLFLTVPLHTPNSLHQQRHCLESRIPSKAQTHRCRQAQVLPHSPQLDSH